MSLDKINVFKIKPKIESFDDFLKAGDFREITLPDLEGDVQAEVRAAFKSSGGSEKNAADIRELSG